jgi:hypothetical protein
MQNERITHHVHHADPNVDRGSKKHTVIEHKKTPTPVSVFQISGLALELCKLPPDADFEAAMEKAFRLLTEYNAKLNALQEPAQDSD